MTRWKQHDMAIMRQALAKISEALPLIELANIAMDDIPAGVTVHAGLNAPHLISFALKYLEQAHTVLSAAISNYDRSASEETQ